MTAQIPASPKGFRALYKNATPRTSLHLYSHPSFNDPIHPLPLTGVLVLAPGRA